MHNTHDEYEQRAKAADAAARRAPSEGERRTFELIAGIWRELAQRYGAAPRNPAGLKKD